jgi:methionine-gamma-lyase
MTYSSEAVFQSICCDDTILNDEGVRAHVQPIYATSTFVYPGPEKAIRIFDETEARPYLYNRWGTPNTALVEAKVAALEACGIVDGNGPLQLEAVLFGSGMAAISALFLSLGLRGGDYIITQGNLYGTTVEFLDVILARQGVRIVYGDLHNLSWLEDQLSINRCVKLIYIETPTNATSRCYDIAALSGMAKKYGVKCAVDSTLATPYLQQPFRHGADFVIHSATKFLNGHSNALAGVVIGRDPQFTKSEVWRMRKVLGGSVGSFDAWLLNMGMKTLPLRMKKHSENAQKVAEFLEGDEHVFRVSYLGLPSHPDHEMARRQMSAFGGVLSFEVRGGREAAIRVMKSIQICTLTATLGAMDTLLQHPASMTHIKVPREQREQHGIMDGLLRLSIGIEDADLIIADLRQALKEVDCSKAS